MAVTKTLLKATSSNDLPMAQMMALVNDKLCDQTDSGMFVLLLVAVLSVKTGALAFCNAGHPSAFLLSATGIAPLDGPRNVALGAMPGLSYHAATAQLAPGAALFLYTDGVSEALDRDDRFYGPARLQIVLKELATLPVEKITRGSVTDVRTFCGEREQSDDISVMALRWLGRNLTPHPFENPKIHGRQKVRHSTAQALCSRYQRPHPRSAVDAPV